MNLYVNNGSWRLVTSLFVNDSGTWRTIKKAWVNQSGTWRQFFTNGFTFNDTPPSDMQNYSLTARATSAGWDGSSPLFATITINVVVGSASVGSYAMVIQSGLPAGSTVNIINNGYIVGMGGAGDVPSGLTAGPGGNGGPALFVGWPTSINNGSGTVAGGGGGAAGSDGQAFDPDSGDPGFSSKAGGGGAGNSVGTQTAPGTGTLPTLTTGGVGNGFPQTGGVGGNLGQDGSSGDYSGGTAGACTSGNSNITWTSVGTRLGTLG